MNRFARRHSIGGAVDGVSDARVRMTIARGTADQVGATGGPAGAARLARARDGRSGRRRMAARHRRSIRR
ncbi:hypothetical protein EMIT0111MI5_70337 [Burkholderia sp. IT-111MI5]